MSWLLKTNWPRARARASIDLPSALGDPTKQVKSLELMEPHSKTLNPNLLDKLLRESPDSRVDSRALHTGSAS